MEPSDEGVLLKVLECLGAFFAQVWIFISWVRSEVGITDALANWRNNFAKPGNLVVVVRSEEVGDVGHLKERVELDERLNILKG